MSLDRLLKTALPDTLAPASASCLDGERLAAWADGTLAAHDAAQVETHLAGCARCQAMLAAFAESAPVPAMAPAAVPFWQRWSLWWLAPVATAAAAVLVWIALPTTPTAPAPATTMARVEPQAVPGPPAAETIAPPVQAPSNAGALDAQAAKADRPVPPPGAMGSSTRSAAQAFRSEGRQVSLAQPPPSPAATVNQGLARADRSTSAPAPAPPTPQTAAAPPPPSATPPSPAAAEPVSNRGFRDLVNPLPGAAPKSDARVGGGGQDNVMIDGISAFDTARSGAIASTAVRVEFSAPGAPNRAAPGAGAAAVGGGGGGRAGGAAGGGRGGTSPPLRWRILGSGALERSTTSGATWEPITITPPPILTSGTAPSALVCWVIGRAGAILRTTDGLRFDRIPPPDVTDLSSIRATSALAATVTTADGRSFTTADGGGTWAP